MPFESNKKTNNFLNNLQTILILKFIFLFLLINSFNLNYNYNNSKVCLCTLGKNENLYAKEFVEHYWKYGVDKIIIYDNNDINGENFNDVIFDYIKKKFVEIINYRGKKKIQMKILKDCYINNNKYYNWLIFYDMDEFIYLKNYSNIKKFLNEKKFNSCKIIHLNWVIHSDNNQLYYVNKTLKERFPKVKYIYKKLAVKSILRGNIKNIKIRNNHIINKRYETCNGFGQKMYLKKNYIIHPDYKYYYIDHYYYKSVEEFINKIYRGSCFYGDINLIKLRRIVSFFRYNSISSEKIKIFKNKTNLNLTKIKKYIKKYKKNKFKYFDKLFN